MTKRLLDIGARMRCAPAPTEVHADAELLPLWQDGAAEAFARVLTGRIVTDFARWTTPAFKELSAFYLREPTDRPLGLRELTELVNELNGAEAYASVALCWSYLVAEATHGRAPADAHPLLIAIVGVHRFVEAALEAKLLRAPEAIERLERILPLLAQIVDERMRARVAAPVFLLQARLAEGLPVSESSWHERGLEAAYVAMRSDDGEHVVLAVLAAAKLLERLGRPQDALYLVAQNNPALAPHQRQLLAAYRASAEVQLGVRAMPPADNAFARELASALRSGTSAVADFVALVRTLAPGGEAASIERVIRLVELQALLNQEPGPRVFALIAQVRADVPAWQLHPWPERVLALAEVVLQLRVEPQAALDLFERWLDPTGEPLSNDDRAQAYVTLLAGWLRLAPPARGPHSARILSVLDGVVALFSSMLGEAAGGRQARRSMRESLDALVTLAGKAYLSLVGSPAASRLGNVGGAYWHFYLTVFVTPQIEEHALDASALDALRQLLADEASEPAVFAMFARQRTLHGLVDFEAERVRRDGAATVRSAWSCRAPTALDVRASGPCITLQPIDHPPFDGLLCGLYVRGLDTRFYALREASQGGSDDRHELRAALSEQQEWTVLPAGDAIRVGTEKLLGFSQQEPPPRLRIVVGTALSAPHAWRAPRSVLFVGGVGAFGRYPALAATASECEHVRAGCARHNASFHALLGSHATPQAFLEAWRSGNFELVHVACHGDSGAIEETAHLILAAGERGPLLTFHDLVGSAVQHAPTVMLSACSASQAIQYRGAAVHGLAQAFLEQGARFVVGPRSAIRDDQAACLAPAIAERMLAGIEPPTALHEARAAAPECDSDYRWACYEMV